MLAQAFEAVLSVKRHFKVGHKRVQHVKKSYWLLVPIHGLMAHSFVNLILYVSPTPACGINLETFVLSLHRLLLNSL